MGRDDVGGDDVTHASSATRPDPAAITPTDAWALLAAGNARFHTEGCQPIRPDRAARLRLTQGQQPLAVFFGCADSRVTPGVIFDQGLGELFVVRTAGHVLDSSVLGSLEYGLDVLGCPLLVVLGHHSCGAVAAAQDAVRTGEVPGGYLRDVIERVTPSVLATSSSGTASTKDVERAHVARTCALIAERSTAIHDRLHQGRLAIVGGHYDLASGEVRVVTVIGEAGVDPGLPV
ncbi:MAG: carbonic anhydrase [Dermatophilaceae bacterium]